MFKNRALRGMGVSGSKQEEVTGGGGCCKLLHYLYLQIKKNTTGIACGMYGGWGWISGGNTSGREYLQELGVSGNMVVKCTLKKYVWRAWSGFIWLGIGAGGAGSCKNVLKLRDP